MYHSRVSAQGVDERMINVHYYDRRLDQANGDWGLERWNVRTGIPSHQTNFELSHPALQTMPHIKHTERQLHFRAFPGFEHKPAAGILSTSGLQESGFLPTVPHSSGAVWKSRWPSWAPVPNKPTVSAHVTEAAFEPQSRHRVTVPSCGWQSSYAKPRQSCHAGEAQSRCERWRCWHGRNVCFWICELASGAVAKPRVLGEQISGSAVRTCACVWSARGLKR